MKFGSRRPWKVSMVSDAWRWADRPFTPLLQVDDSPTPKPVLYDNHGRALVKDRKVGFKPPKKEGDGTLVPEGRKKKKGNP